jgi:hypothetical protein
VTDIIQFKRDVLWKHYDSKPIEGYIYKKLFPSNLFFDIRNAIKTIIDNQNTKTFMMSGTEIVLDNNTKIKLFDHQQNDREQFVLIDQSFEKKWYYQTVDTIKEWSDKNLKEKLNPHILYTLYLLEQLEPFNSKDYVFNRIHINYLEPGKMLGLHKDGGPFLLNSNNIHTNYSITVYLYDHVEGLGGEFWGPCGFVYKPMSNTALVVNGQDAMHGVTQNISDVPRLAFTIRATHKSSLFLPGHPDKFLWDVSSSI